MKLRTIGKVQIFVTVIFFLTMIIVNIVAYFAIQNVTQNATSVGREFAQTQYPDMLSSGIFQINNTAIAGTLILFIEIIIAADSIILLLLIALFLNGLAMISQD